MKRTHEWIHQRKKLGTRFSEEDSGEGMVEPTEEQVEEPVEERAEEQAEIMEEKIGVRPARETAIALRPLRKSYRTIRKRKKIGGELIEKEMEDQKAKIKEQIEELPKEHRKTFLEELLKKYE